MSLFSSLFHSHGHDDAATAPAQSLFASGALDAFQFQALFAHVSQSPDPMDAAPHAAMLHAEAFAANPILHQIAPPEGATPAMEAHFDMAHHLHPAWDFIQP